LNCNFAFLLLNFEFFRVYQDGVLLRVFFVYPNVGGQVGFNYGLASISAVLKEAGHETHLLNINEKLYPVPEDSEVVKEVLRFKPGLVGFSIVSLQFPYALRLARAIKRESDVPIIAGGVHATMVPEDVLATGVFDYACVGEGEFALLQLVSALEKKSDTGNIPGIWKREGRRTIANPVGPFPELPVLPFKDYSISDFQHLTDVRGGWVGVMAGRGCPFVCTYCFNHQIVKRYQRERGKRVSELRYIRFSLPEAVVAEMGYLARTFHGISMFCFDDDIFTLDARFVEEFCRLYRESGIGIPLTVNAHVRFFSPETAEHLAAAGSRIVKFGVESGSARIRREVLHRYMTNAQVARAFELAHRAGLHSSAFLMLGLPLEKKEDMVATVNLLARILPGRFRWSVFYPFPGTKAFKIAQEAGLIDAEKMRSLTNFFTESPLDFGAELNLFIDKLNTAFPWFVNAASGLPCAPTYKRLVAEIERLTEKQWGQRKRFIEKEDAALSESFLARGIEHYAIKYNRFMGVNSKYFSIEG
jgi:radical SAM superfamily enzyme YgiQ (UPF0313 family)